MGPAPALRTRVASPDGNLFALAGAAATSGGGGIGAAADASGVDTAAVSAVGGESFALAFWQPKDTDAAHRKRMLVRRVPDIGSFIGGFYA